LSVELSARRTKTANIYIAVMIISDKQGCSDFSIDKV